jgi:hypothetical protein
MGNELSNQEITLPNINNKFQLNEPKSPEFIFNNSIFPDKENSKDLKILFQESLNNDSKTPNLKKSFSKEDIKKKTFQEEKNLKNLTLPKENLNITKTTNI